MPNTMSTLHGITHNSKNRALPERTTKASAARLAQLDAQIWRYLRAHLGKDFQAAMMSHDYSIMFSLSDISGKVYALVLMSSFDITQMLFFLQLGHCMAVTQRLPHTRQATDGVPKRGDVG